MNRVRLILACILCAVTGLSAEDRDAAVKRDEHSIHTIERSLMPIVASAKAILTSRQPGLAVLPFENDPRICEIGRDACLDVAESQEVEMGRLSPYSAGLGYP